MSHQKRDFQRWVRRDHAEAYILTTLIAFALTVIVTRVFLELTGYPQLGNGVLHIAHALWGGLALIIAAAMPLALANRWALRTSAILNGLGTGLFIDEVGKFITQTNDYFFPPALSIIYGFFLLFVAVFIFLRRSRKMSARLALYHALEGLQDVIDGDLDVKEVNRIQAQLASARESNRKEVVALATVLGDFMKQEEMQFSPARSSPWKRIVRAFDALGQRLGRRVNRAIVGGILVLWLIIVSGYIFVLLQGAPNLDQQVLQLRGGLIGIQAIVGLLLLAAVINWFARREEYGLTFGIVGFLFSLVGLQMLYFYISQFSAITATLLQFLFLQMLLAYRRWYLAG